MNDSNRPKQYLYRRVVQAKMFIDSNYFEAIDLNNISDEAFFSKFHFLRLFKRIYGCTPHKYLSQVRIEKAKLLLEKNVPIAAVCAEVGFESISSFTGLFKKRVGTIPSEYQKQRLLLKQAIEKAPLDFIPNCFAENKGWTKS